MWSTAASAESSANPDAIWALYTDVAHWTDWDDGLDVAGLHGDFAAGTRGFLRPTGAPMLSFVLTAVDRGREFRDRTPFPHRLLPLAYVDFRHTLEPLPGGGTRITHAASITGLFGGLVSRILGKSFVEGLPVTVQNVAQLAANRRHAAA